MIIYNIINKVVLALAITTLFFSCSTEVQNQKDNTSYIDIPAYFQKEIIRLKTENPTVVKTVKKDKQEETKEVQIANWENELSNYLNIDLNKPAYHGLFTKDSTDYKVTFSAKDSNLDISFIEISYVLTEPVEFKIKRKVKNSLYQTEETLYYHKNKSYSLEKHQSVIALDDNHYYIEGRFK